MHDSLEEQQFTRWLRRPTIFIANTWYLMGAAGATIVGYMIAFIVQALALTGIVIDSTVTGHTASAVYEIGVLALPVVWYAAKHEGVGQSMRLNPPKMSAMLYAAAMAVVGVLAVNCLSSWWLLLIEALGGTLYESGIPIPTNIDELTVSVLLVGVIPGVCEELFFRGGLMGAWERRGTKQALVITSALFAMLHGSILGLPTQILMGFVLGYVLILSDSLYVSMIYHTVHNSTTLILTYLSASSGMQADVSASLAAQIGGPAGFIALAVQTVFYGGIFGMMLYMFGRMQKISGQNAEKITVGDKNPMTWQELVVLIAGLLTVGMTYLTDLLTVCGIMQ